MRLRNTLVAATSAIALVLAVPVSANAADGVFRYTYRDGGSEHRGQLVDPRGGECVDVQGTAGAEVAYAPANRTNRTAVTFLALGCVGDVYRALDPGDSAGRRLSFRSVLFS
ncbi:hypothetical protein [Streptomyces sp. NRRL S-495]|uniref:hypothetical protein n=1 Tax=Streptomyces sp. NRRL S-495 TaxID=1609133 RepID=UPI0005F96A63|nr:hypothetical protein [Streptomyces sp. NRRL S-495]KJY28414.1 hypothetical protein VR45_32500 [Streptomyces sp. NRRL S-495]